MVCIVFVYCTATNLALWLQQTNKVYTYLLTNLTASVCNQSYNIINNRNPVDYV